MDTDVIVVGAGFSGLAAAMKLRETGVSCMLVEARNRAGGRTENHPIGGGNFADLGAGWVSPGHQHILALIERFGLTTWPTYTAGEAVTFIEGRCGRMDMTGEHSAPAWDATLNVLSALDKFLPDICVEAPWESKNALELDSIPARTWLRQNVSDPTAMLIVESIIDGYIGASSQFSLLHLLVYGKSNKGFASPHALFQGQRRVKEGTQGIALRMAESLGDIVHLNQAVQSVEQDRDSVKIRTSGSAFRARRVILAMPPLHAGRILAGDRIPAARRQVEIRSPLGGGYKFHFVYDDSFWRSEGLSGQALSFDHPVSSVFDGSPMDSSCGVLTGLCEPLRSRELATATPEERQIVATRCLAEFFGDKASRPRAVIEKYWEQDPWSLGCVFYMTPGAWTTCGEALRRPVGRVHFAGTETATDSICNMNGAVQAGWRAAEEVAAGL